MSHFEEPLLEPLHCPTEAAQLFDGFGGLGLSCRKFWPYMQSIWAIV